MIMLKQQEGDRQGTDILSLIETDHNEIKRLFEEMQSAKGKKAQICFENIYKELSLHAKAEELVFYPAMREFKETEKYIEEAASEHNGAKILREQMKSLQPEDEEFQTKLGHLIESVLHHVEEEESDIFEAVRKCMSVEQLQELAGEFESAKSRSEADVDASITRK
jgi:hemerythrin superfamily protein